MDQSEGTGLDCIPTPPAVNADAVYQQGAVVQGNRSEAEWAALADQVVLEWLPSISIVRKHRVPAVAGIAFLYSELRDRVYHVFSTDDLHASVMTQSRQQSRALRFDTECRIGWLQVDDPLDRQRILQALKGKYLPQHTDAA